MDGNNKALRFTIEIFNAQFVTAGRYFLILRIIGSNVNRSKLKLFVGNSKLPLEDHEFTTDACLEDGDPETFATFTDSVISFWMPPESADGDIQLVVEAFCLPENPMHEGDKYGEAVFSVFPRRGSLFSAVGQTTPSSEDSSELYQFETNITLSQVQEGGGFWINSGAIRASVKLKYEEPEQTTKQQVKQLASDDVLSGTNSLSRKQRKAGSLANLIPSSEFEVSEMREITQLSGEFRGDSDQFFDKTGKDESGSDSFDLVPKVLGMQLDSFVVEKQGKAGSLANLCPSTCSYRYREFVDEVKNKEDRARVEDVETGEVISVCESE